MTPTSTEVDVVLMLVVLGLAAVAALAAHVGWVLQPVRPWLPDEDCPPPGLGRLVPVGQQVDQEVRRGLTALEVWLRSSPLRP